MQILIVLNNRNSESDIGVNAEKNREVKEPVTTETF